jgi:hypothetical protein
MFLQNKQIIMKLPSIFNFLDFLSNLFDKPSLKSNLCKEEDLGLKLHIRNLFRYGFTFNKLIPIFACSKSNV